MLEETHLGRKFQLWIASRATYLKLKKLKRPCDDVLEEVANLAGELLLALNAGFPPPAWTHDQALDFVNWNAFNDYVRFVLPASPPRQAPAIEEPRKANVA